MSGRGRGRGRGRPIQDEEDENQNPFPPVVGRGRGRSRGTRESTAPFTPFTPYASSRGSEFRADEEEVRAPRLFDEPTFSPPPQPSTSRDQQLLAPNDSSSDEDDDFISQFRRLHPLSTERQVVPPAVSTPHLPSEGLGGNGSEFARGRGRQRVPLPQGSGGSSSSSPSVKSAGSTQLWEGSSGSSEGEVKVVSKHGSKGKVVNMCVNFIRLKVQQGTGLFEYHVDFEPFIDSIGLRKRVIYRADTELGTVKNFDGAKLYLPYKLPQPLTVFEVDHPVIPHEHVQVHIKFVKQNNLDDCHFYNILFRRVMDKLGYLEMKRNFFDYQNVYQVPQHRLDIWPGYVTAVDIYEDGLMINCDSTFRVLRKDTLLNAWDEMKYIAEQDRSYNVEQRYKDFVLNKIVLTKYNNKHYRIDDVEWTKSPRDTFLLTRGGVPTPISFVDYYYQNYNVAIQDLGQPLLISRSKPKRTVHARDFAPPEQILLIPELCHVTGMTEDLTDDHRIMKAIAEKTRLKPLERIAALNKFIRSVNGNPEARKILEDWGLQLDDGVVHLNGRNLGPPKILVGREGAIMPRSGDFGQELSQHHVLEPVPVQEWIVVCDERDKQKAVRAVNSYRSVAPGLGIDCRVQPRIVSVRGNKSSDFRDALSRSVQRFTQFVMVIIPANRDDLYRVIKQFCTREVPVASQVLRAAPTLSTADESKFRSIMQKVALQINCKLGGALWTIKIPLPEKIMFIGMDVYHDPKGRSRSVTAVVASINLCYTKYYTRVLFQEVQQENISSLRPVIREALEAFYQENQQLPDRIIMFRDGVGDGQLELTRQHEVSQILLAFDDLHFKPNFTFCVVQKRINARLFLMNGSFIDNPPPGTVLDHTVTRRAYYDFFLVSQIIREGTVNPTHYIVLHDDGDIEPDQMQKISYAASYMYYNWAGPIRVPAMCQYAHKAAFLVGKHINQEPVHSLHDKLYYL